MPYALHAVIIHKNIPLEKAKTIASDIIKNPNRNFYRLDSESYRFRNLPKTYFDNKTFRSKIINKDITLVFGELLQKYYHLK